MKATRRMVLAGALAVPATASLAAWRWQLHGGAVVLYDPALPQGRALARAESGRQLPALALEGDRIRFAREIFARRPSVVRGVTRQADAVLIEDVGAEAGYERVALAIEGNVLTWTLALRPQRCA